MLWFTGSSKRDRSDEPPSTKLITEYNLNKICYVCSSLLWEEQLIISITFFALITSNPESDSSHVTRSLSHAERRFSYKKTFKRQPVIHHSSVFLASSTKTLPIKVSHFKILFSLMMLVLMIIFSSPMYYYYKYYNYYYYDYYYYYY